MLAEIGEATTAAIPQTQPDSAYPTLPWHRR